MNLSEALKTHLGCEHSLLVKRVGDTQMSVRHRKDGTMRFGIFSEGVLGGAQLFHAIALSLMGEDGHTRTPMFITDEEYAGFVEGS